MFTLILLLIIEPPYATFYHKTELSDTQKLMKAPGCYKISVKVLSADKGNSLAGCQDENLIDR